MDILVNSLFWELTVCRQKDNRKVELHFHALLGVEGVRHLWD